uniref:Lin1244/Lin1753-like N-terminal domain-containing protein n=1 Tax=viral metagenome TaxID=1070528 RepID=A0A6M3IZG2_9ZZZZ
MSDKEFPKEYLRHDYGARTDTRKMRKFVRKFGMRGYGLFWAMAEMLYKEGGYIPIEECDNIAEDLDVDAQEVKDVIDYMFHTDKEKFWSNTVMERLAERAGKIQQARGAAYAGWKKRKGDEYEPPDNVDPDKYVKGKYGHLVGR